MSCGCWTCDGSERHGGSTAWLGNGVNRAVVLVIDVSVLYLTVKLLCLFARKFQAWDPDSLERFRLELKPEMADQDAKDEAAKKRIITHMNEDHRDSVCVN